METQGESELMAMDEEGERERRKSAKRPHPLTESPFASMHVELAKEAGDDNDSARREKEEKKGRKRFMGNKRRDQRARGRAEAQRKDT